MRDIGVYRSSTVVIREESWWFRNFHNSTSTSSNRLNLLRRVVLDCGRGWNRSSTVAESGSFLDILFVYSWSFLGFRGELGYQLIHPPIHQEYSKTALRLFRGTTVVAPSWIAVDTQRHRKKIVRHRSDFWIFCFNHSNASRFYSVGYIRTNRGES